MPSEASTTIEITREFDAPLSLVWKAFTDPEHIAAWFGPEGFTTRVEDYDFIPGGRWAYVMVGPDGKEYPCHGLFSAIEDQDHFVSTDEFGDEIKNSDADCPEGMVVETKFEAAGGKTRVTIAIHHTTPEDKQKHEELGVVDGWNSSFACLDEHLAGLQQ